MKLTKKMLQRIIKEVIFEEGTLSGIITEVAKGLGSVNINARAAQPVAEQRVIKSNQPSQAVLQAKQSLEETKRSLQNSTGLKGIFEGTTPMRSNGGSQSSQHGALRDMDPSDPGVDISGIMKIAGGAWNQLK